MAKRYKMTQNLMKNKTESLIKFNLIKNIMQKCNITFSGFHALVLKQLFCCTGHTF